MTPSPDALSSTAATAPKPWMVWAGRVVSALPVLGLVMSASMKLQQGPTMVENWTQKLGFPTATLPVLGVVELTCALLYALPWTSGLGAVLLTGYLGGAVAAHVRIGEGFGGAVLFGVLVWAGLFLRDARVRSLMPLRRLP